MTPDKVVDGTPPPERLRIRGRTLVSAGFGGSYPTEKGARAKLERLKARGPVTFGAIVKVKTKSTPVYTIYVDEDAADTLMLL